MNRRNLPLNALRAFEATARHSSLSRAAQELTVTHAAISHQIKALESQIGQSLFHRTNRGVTLTDAGQTLFPTLNEAFENIGVAFEAFQGAAQRSTLQVTLTPSFATKWLVPRLKSWHRSHPNLEIRLLPTLEQVDFSKTEADLAIRCGRPPWFGTRAEQLLPITMTAVCSPAFIETHGALETPAQLLSLPLIHADVGDHEKAEEWRTWLAAAGVTGITGLPGPSFHDPGLAWQAALDGQGLAIGYRELLQNEFDHGALVQPFDIEVRHSFSYYLVHPEARAQDPRIHAFRDWVMAEGRRSIGERET